jgi:hypothetical protein
MSTLEDIRQDGKRQDAEERFEREAPAPCGCLFFSSCCGAPPGFGITVTADSPTGICGQCRDHAAFEPSDENTWKLTSTGVYGDDADGNRGVPLRAYECRECGAEVEVTG